MLLSDDASVVPWRQVLADRRRGSVLIRSSLAAFTRDGSLLRAGVTWHAVRHVDGGLSSFVRATSTDSSPNRYMEDKAPVSNRIFEGAAIPKQRRRPRLVNA